MDIYNYIESKDIRKYLRDIKYEFSADEKLFLVQNSYMTIDERFVTYLQLMSDDPEAMITDRDELLKRGCEINICEFLSICMEREQKEREHFKMNDEAYYTLSYWPNISGLNHNYIYEVPEIFYEFGDCMDYIKTTDEVKNALFYEMKKHYSCPNNYGAGLMWLNAALEPTYVYDNTLTADDITQKTNENFFVGEIINKCFAFPTPFRRGDIVCSCDEPDCPLVLYYINTWTAQECIANGFRPDGKVVDERFHILDDVDSCDMTAICYRLTWKDKLKLTEEVPYLKLEYYRKPLEEKYSMLRKISRDLIRPCSV